MKKPSKAKKGSAKSARAPRSPSHGVAVEAAAAHTPPPPAAAELPASPAGKAPGAAFAPDDRLSFALLLAPVLAVTLALGATQLLVPADSARRQLALLPAPLALPAAAPVFALSAGPGAIDHTLGPVTDRLSPASAIGVPTLQTTAVYERARPVSSVAELRGLPPGESVLAKLAALGHPDRCEIIPALGSTAAPASVSPESFGRMLAAAARHETEDLVVYTDKYRDMGFPMGDVRPLYGVCTDVVVRAYRALGIDLQVLVHNAKLGTGDPAIDHRRVETLRRFFAKYGTSLPVTDFAEEFLPGDIVTYRRPEGRGSQTHIAIVSDVIAPSGRPMVVHNRGWGPQIEDALFANGMTGHYRFSKAAPELSASAPRPAQHVEQTPMPVPKGEPPKVNTAAR